MISTDVTQLVAALTTDPDARYGLRDALIEENRWDWEAVRDIVCAHPKPDGPRLLAADWLDHAGDHKTAEYVRLAVELETTRYRWCKNHTCPSRGSHSDDRRETGFCSCDIDIHRLRERCNKLRRKVAFFTEVQTLLAKFNAQEWRVRTGFRRGFLEDLWVTQEQWEDLGDTAVSMCPILRVRVTDGWELDGPPKVEFRTDRTGVRKAYFVVTVAGKPVHIQLAEKEVKSHEVVRIDPIRWLSLRWPGVSFYLPTHNDPQPHDAVREFQVAAYGPVHVGDPAWVDRGGRVIFTQPPADASWRVGTVALVSPGDPGVNTVRVVIPREDV